MTSRPGSAPARRSSRPRSAFGTARSSYDESLPQLDHSGDRTLLSRDSASIASLSYKPVTTTDGVLLGSPVMPELEVSFSGHMRAFNTLEQASMDRATSTFRDNTGTMHHKLEKERDPDSVVRVVDPPAMRPCLDLKHISSEHEFHGAILNGQHEDCLICFPKKSKLLKVDKEDPLKYTSEYLEHREKQWNSHFSKGQESIPPYDAVLDNYCPRIHEKKEWKKVARSHRLIDEKTRLMNGRSMLGKPSSPSKASVFVPPFLSTLEERDANSFERLKYKWRQASKDDKKEMKHVVLNALMKGHNLVEHQEDLAAIPSIEESPMTEYIVNATRPDWGLSSWDRSVTQFPVRDKMSVRSQAAQAERGSSRMFSGGNLQNHFRYTVAKVNSFKKKGSMEITADVLNTRRKP